MKVKCNKQRCGDLGSRVVVGNEYFVLAIEASTGDAVRPAGPYLFVGLTDGHASAPVSFFDILEDTVPEGWRMRRVNNRWLIGYEFMLDLEFQIGLERGEAEFIEKYHEHMQTLW